MHSGQRKGQRVDQTEKGQASIMIGMMIMTFILFFAFVTNTGMLVNAKINLQNAADMAAYAGAAVQARQLTTISYLNYEMRRQYKKFLFRYYVIGNMAQGSQPKTPGSGPRNWCPNASDSSCTAAAANSQSPLINYKVPAVCLTYKQQDNYCQTPKVPAVNGPGNTFLTDQISTTLNAQLQQLETIRQNNCVSISNENDNVLTLWLYNTDPDLTTLPNLLNTTGDPQKQELAQAIQVVKGIAQGIGLVPREILLHQRIQTMEGYVNFPPQTGVTFDQIQGKYEAGADPQSSERTIQAFLSAFYTLGDQIYNDPTAISMDELMPAQLLELEDVKASFDTFAIVYELANGQSASGSANNCISKLSPHTVPPIPLGVFKNPSVMTYYAVRVNATARVLFSPFGNLQLKAYAAARPFGSRIGPANLTAADFTRPSNLPIQQPGALNNNPGSLASNSGGNAAIGTLANVVPNLQVVDSDSAATGQGWDTNFMTGSMYQIMNTLAGGGPGGPVLSGPEAQTAYFSAMAPNPPEGARYNVINDNPADIFVRNFDSTEQAALWAPVFPLDQVSQGIAELPSTLASLFATNSGIGNSTISAGGGSGQYAAIQTLLSSLLLKYIGALQQGAGECVGAAGANCEGMNVVQLSNPFTDPLGNPLPVSSQIMMNDPTQYRTSFANINDNTIKQTGRTGYSVKLVSFDSLTAHPSSTDGATTPQNLLSPQLDDAARDISSIKH